MKVKLLTNFAGVVVLVVILLTGFQPAVAAPPSGEIKTVDSMFGNEIPVPFLEIHWAMDWMGLLYDSLVGTTPEGKFSPDYGLANRWEMAPDGLTWTFYLRKGVKFHDGVEVTAKDVKFSIEQQLLPIDSASSDAVYIRRIVKSVEVKDPYTVVFHCKQPNIFLLKHLSNLEGPAGMIAPKDYYERVGKDQFIKRPIGSGPYKWHSQMSGSFIKLEATEKHWRYGVPKYKYMTFLVIPEESTRIAMLKTGEADIARLSRQRVEEARSAGLNIITKDGATILTYRIAMQWTSRAFSDIRFRKALNLAIDKEAIIKQLLAGMAKPIAIFPGPGISAFGGDPTLKPYPYDLGEARRLIKEGGYEGYEFIVPNYARAGFPELSLINEAVVGYWEKAGLKPKIQMTEWAAFRKFWRTRKLENFIYGMDGSGDPDVSTLLVRFMQRYYFNHMESTVNIPELNERFERIEKSMDISEIQTLLAEIYRYSYDHFLEVPVCGIVSINVTSKKIPKWDLGQRLRCRNFYDLIEQR